MNINFFFLYLVSNSTGKILRDDSQVFNTSIDYLLQPAGFNLSFNFHL